MKKLVALSAAAAALALSACGGAADEPAPAAEAMPNDDNDTIKPVSEPAHDEAEPHDESVPHEH